MEELKEMGYAPDYGIIEEVPIYTEIQTTTPCTLTIKSQNKEFVIEGVEKNENNFISDEKIDTSEWPEIFEITATDYNNLVIMYFKNAKVISNQQFACLGNKWYLGIVTVQDDEIAKIKTQSSIEYIAMMSDIELEE